MPLVRMLTSVAGQDPLSGEPFAWQEGEEVTMSPAQAAVWADGERGELVRSAPPETPEGNQAARATRPEVTVAASSIPPIVTAPSTEDVPSAPGKKPPRRGR